MIYTIPKATGPQTGSVQKERGPRGRGEREEKRKREILPSPSPFPLISFFNFKMFAQMSLFPDRNSYTCCVNKVPFQTLFKHYSLTITV